MAKLFVLVAGATGQQGGAVAHCLLERGHRVRAMTRDPSSEAARHLEREGAELVRADLADRASLDHAMKGVHAVFAMTVPSEIKEEVKEGRHLVDAARHAEVQHVVHSSVAGADRETRIPFFDSKNSIEAHLRSNGVPWTIVAPAWFMENLLAQREEIEGGTLSLALPPDRELQCTAVGDIGRFVVRCLEERLIGQRFEIASDQVTPRQMAAELTRAVGRQVRFAEASLDELEGGMRRMFEWLREEGARADVDRLRQEHRQVGWTRFADWVMESPLCKEPA